MTLSPETRLGSYTITSLLGAGGMGEVYRATDSKLGREVAIKVLPDAFAKDPERLARFDQEARLLASLNHPNIAAIHGLEESDGVRFLVLELVPGDTLAERIAGGPIPVDEALTLCRQIAEALEAAHERGIIHRDLKPANVKVTPEGKVKVLDFGLAKAFEPHAASVDLSQVSTKSFRRTREGVILGTAAYMSPEQARGKPVDKRTDIWSFGCVLYECLTERQAFSGESITDVLAAIVKEEPDWERLPVEVQRSIRRLLRRSLAKDPRERLQAIGDARIELAEFLQGGLDVDTLQEQVNGDSRRTWRRVAIALGVAALAGWLVSTLLLFNQDLNQETQALTRFAIDLSPDQRVYSGVDIPTLEISPDGRTLAWIGNGRDNQVIYTRSLDGLEVRALPETEGVQPLGLSFSPDGRWIAFVRDGSLWRIAVSGGGLAQLASTGTISGFDWGEDGSIVIADSLVLYVLNPNGESPEQITTLDLEKREVFHYNPRFLPGGHAIFFTVCIGNWNDYHLEVLSLESGERHKVYEDAAVGYYAPSGHLLFGRGDTIFAVPFDLNRLVPTGPETPVLHPVQMNRIGRVPQFIVSANGTLAYTPGGQGIGQKRIVRLNRGGEIEPLPVPPGRYFDPRLSPDGTQLALAVGKGRFVQVSLFSLARNVFSQFTFEGSDSGAPVWSPDGSRIAFGSNRAGQYNLFVQQTKVGGAAEHLAESADVQVPRSWSRDGKLIAYSEWNANGQYDIWVLSVGSDESHRIPLLTSKFQETGSMFSPDGRWIAYVSDESGRQEVFIQELSLDNPQAVEKRKISRNGGLEPKWAREGNELFYRSLDGSKLLGVTIESENALKIGQEGVVIDKAGFSRVDPWGESYLYDVSPDRDRFLALVDVRTDVVKLVVVENWFEELKRLVPTESD